MATLLNSRTLQNGYTAAVHCKMATCCGVLRCVAVRCGALRCVAVCCGVLWYVAVCGSVLQRVAEFAGGGGRVDAERAGG